MAKHRSKTTQADGIDPYSTRRYMKGRKTHLAGVNHQDVPDKPGGWVIVIAGLFVLALVVVMAIN